MVSSCGWDFLTGKSSEHSQSSSVPAEGSITMIPRFKTETTLSLRTQAQKSCSISCISYIDWNSHTPTRWTRDLIHPRGRMSHRVLESLKLPQFKVYLVHLLFIWEEIDVQRIYIVYFQSQQISDKLPPLKPVQLSFSSYLKNGKIYFCSWGFSHGPLASLSFGL